MYRAELICLLLLSVWCFHKEGVLFAGAQPTITAMILTPETDRKEGGSVEMRCVASNLTSSHIVEWRTEEPELFLRFGTQTYWTDSRFMFETLITENEYIQEIVIDPLLKNDTDEYICNVLDLTINTGNRVVATDRVKLSVLYFPNEPFPICSPDGAITVKVGSKLDMQCSSEAGNSAVMMEVLKTAELSKSYMWTIITSNNTITGSSNSTVDYTDNNIRFLCVISSVYYPGMVRSCQIGPIKVCGRVPLVTGNSEEGIMTTEISKTSSNIQTPIECTNIQPSPPTPWIAAFVVAVVFLALSCVIVILLTCKNFKQRRLISSLIKKTSFPVPKSDPYTELQRTGDSNTAYTEPVTKGSTSTRHTYYNTLDIENEKTADDYEQPEDKYEAVGAPKRNQNKI